MALTRWLTPLALLTLGACTANDPDGSAGGNLEAGTSSCAAAHITFTMGVVAGDPTAYCVGAPGACSHQWLSILDPGGAEVAIDHPCVADCETCQPVGCPAMCAAPTPIKPGGETRTWDGSYFAASSCGAGLSCVNATCAGAGRYVARMCGFADPAPSASPPYCSPVQTPTCAEVSFDWPPPGGSGSVTGTIGAPSDGGSLDGGDACCPAAWSLYGCTHPDGGAGFACHNPAMGCASSTICGEGCDRVVAGRCDGGT